MAILIPMFFLCLGLDNCKSPEEPEPIDEYRYNVEVIYTRGAGDYQKAQDYVRLHYYLYDPAIRDWPNYWTDLGTIKMYKIGENKYRCYLHKVFIQTPRKYKNHRVIVDDWITNGGMKGESVDIQGAYAQEIEKIDELGNAIWIWVKFKMSKN
jgi:hypothetical protein